MILLPRPHTESEKKSWWQLTILQILVWASLFFFFFSVQGRILALPPGIEPVSLVLEAWSFNHWTTGEVPKPHFLPSLTSSLLSGYMRLYQSVRVAITKNHRLGCLNDRHLFSHRPEVPAQIIQTLFFKIQVLLSPLNLPCFYSFVQMPFLLFFTAPSKIALYFSCFQACEYQIPFTSLPKRRGSKNL